MVMFVKAITKEHIPRHPRGAKGILRDALLTLLLLGAAFGVSLLLPGTPGAGSTHAAPVFILAVSLIARFTRGYAWGVAASFVSVLCVNTVFTYPYWRFDLSIAGYPLTFACILIVSLLVSTLTTRLNRLDELRFEMRAESMRANLLRAVSHDLRTPLASIVGASSTLLENPDLSEETRRELLGAINMDARWLTRVTENLLSVTKFAGGRVELKKEAEVVEEIVSNAIVKFRKEHPDLRFVVERPDRILLALMDATLIVQVLINLFDNAVEHGGATRIDVSIAREADRVRVTVADNGSGMDPARLRTIFDANTESTDANGDSRRNMGIGLSVCRSILLAHGGDITARNLPGGGAAFEFTLIPEGEDTDEYTAE